MKSKYSYGGMTLYKYCKENGLDYSLLIQAISKLKDIPEFKNYDDDKIVKIVVEKQIDSKDRNYFGFSLFQYCKLNNLNYTQISSRVTSLRKKEEHANKSNEELVSLALNSEFSIYRNHYRYNGELLQEYCKRNEISIESVVKRINKIKEKYPDQNEEEVIKLALDFDYIINQKVYSTK